MCANLKTKISSDFLPLEIISAIVSLPEEGEGTLDVQVQWRSEKQSSRFSTAVRKSSASS